MLKKDPETAKAEDDRSIWILSDGKAGDEIQCMGVAEALGLPYQIRRVAPRKPFVWAMPWGPIDPREAETRPGSPLAPPYPDIAIASGRRTVPYLRRLKKLSGGRTFTVFLKDPRTGTKTADLIWVGEHDRLRGANVLVTPTAPHRHSAEKLAAARAQPDPRLAGLPSPRIAVLVGGNSRHHTFTAEDIASFADGLADAARGGGSLMITASRRTPLSSTTGWSNSRKQETISCGTAAVKTRCWQCWRWPIPSWSRATAQTWWVRRWRQGGLCMCSCRPAGTTGWTVF